MGDAYQCEMCGKLVKGEPAITISANAWARQFGGNIVTQDGTEIEWDWDDTYIDLCPDHASEVMGAVLND